MSKSDVDNAEHVRTDEVKLIKTDVASSAITYVGRAKRMTSLTSDAEWQLKRTLRQGDITTVTFADEGKYTQIWDNRATAFPSAALGNVYSTNFDGVNDQVNAGNVLNYDTGSAFSVSGWFKPQNLAATRCLFGKTTNDANVDGWNVQHLVTTGLLQLQMRASSTDTAYAANVGLTAAQWAHVVFTYSGSGNISGARLYVNNVVGSTPASAVISGTMLAGQDFTLGSRNGAFPFSGNIDEFSAWGKALTADEVSQIYNSGQPGNLEALSFAADLVLWWRMGDGDSFPTILDNAGTNNGTMQNMTASDFETVVP